MAMAPQQIFFGNHQGLKCLNFQNSPRHIHRERYHRFTLIFDSPSEESLVFNVESCEDPEVMGEIPPTGPVVQLEYHRPNILVVSLYISS